MMILSLLLLSSVDMRKSFKVFSIEFNTGRGTASLAPNLPNLRTVHWATVARRGKHRLLGSFLFVIASPGIRHLESEAFRSSIARVRTMNILGFGVLCTWLSHVTDAGQSVTSLLLDDSGSQSHALY